MYKLPLGQELPGQERGQLWMWLRPLRTMPGGSGADVARRVPLAPEVGCMSFGHLLELLFGAAHLRAAGVPLQVIGVGGLGFKACDACCLGLLPLRCCLSRLTLCRLLGLGDALKMNSQHSSSPTRIRACVQAGFVRYMGLGGTLVCLHYEPVAPCGVHLPPLAVGLAPPEERGWLTEEVDELGKVTRYAIGRWFGEVK